MTNNISKHVFGKTLEVDNFAVTKAMIHSKIQRICFKMFEEIRENPEVHLTSLAKMNSEVLNERRLNEIITSCQVITVAVSPIPVRSYFRPEETMLFSEECRWHNLETLQVYCVSNL